MCGRFAQRSDPKRLAKEFKVAEAPAVEARYNIAPTQNILGVRTVSDEREMAFFKWGLIPSWAKDASMGARLINARAETVEEKPSFRQAFKQRRCIIPVDGFYEWRREGGKKQPFFFRLRDERPFGFAGLWERWEGEAGAAINSCTILTTEANEVLRPVHERMPVILHPDDYELWLDVDARKRDLVKELLRPYAAEEMLGYPVSASINSPQNQGATLIERATLNSA
ncbi:MAG TPA: SOS response-associated peptidase [Pyrinomonadaceae bacterium]|nr:SOS response-associated peptidase [Pyrinomonadaceae bacterium]